MRRRRDPERPAAGQPGQQVQRHVDWSDQQRRALRVGDPLLHEPHRRHGDRGRL